MERAHPIQSAALCSCRTVCIHPVHAVFCEQRHQRLCQFFHCFVERFGRFVAVFTQCFVLSQQQTLDSTHQSTAFAGQVGIHFLFECRFEQITGTDTDTQCDYPIPCFTRCILEDCVAGVQATSLQEHTAQWSARTFRSDQDHVYISRRDDVGTFLVSDSETVGEIQRLARSQVFLDARPAFDLSGVGKQDLYDGCFFASFFDTEQCFARHPTVGNSLVVRLARTLSYDHIETVVTQVQTLSRTLNTVTDHCDYFIFQHFSCFFQRKFFAGYYVFVNTAKIHYCHFLFILKCI